MVSIYSRVHAPACLYYYFFATNRPVALKISFFKILLFAFCIKINEV